MSLLFWWGIDNTVLLYIYMVYPEEIWERKWYDVIHK